MDMTVAGAEYVSPPDELTKLGCTAKRYAGEILWLKALYGETVKSQELYSEKYGKGMALSSKRKLTKVEVKRLVADISKMHLILVQTRMGFFNGIAYWFYTNPQADRLAEGLPPRGLLQGVKPQFLFMLHWECLERSLLSGDSSDASTKDLIKLIFEFFQPYSHSKMNVAWQSYWHLPHNAGLDSCYY